MMKSEGVEQIYFSPNVMIHPSTINRATEQPDRPRFDHLQAGTTVDLGGLWRCPRQQ